MESVFTDAQIDDFIKHWIKKYPDALSSVFRYWDELNHSNNSKILARILHQKRKAIQDFPARLQVTSDDDSLLSDFDLAVMDRIHHLRRTGEIVGPRNYPPGDFERVEDH